jgi:hypothetical protein
VQHHDRPDRELVELARRGWASGFAVLLYRHAADVRAVVEPAPDPLGAVRDTYLVAMRRLDRLPVDQDVRDWLLELAAGRVKDPRPAPDPGEAQPLDDADLDELWAELAERWPDGRKPPRPLPTALRWAGVALLLVAVAAAVPLVVFAALEAEDDDVEEVRAQLHEREDDPDEDVEDEPADPNELELDELDGGPIDTEAGADTEVDGPDDGDADDDGDDPGDGDASDAPGDTDPADAPGDTGGTGDTGTPDGGGDDDLDGGEAP